MFPIFKTSSTLLYLKQPTLWILLVTLTFLGITLALIAGVSPLFPLAIAISIAALALAFHSPLLLLSLLIIIRMSLDALSRYYTFWAFDSALTLSQLVGIGVALIGALMGILLWQDIRRYPLRWPFLLIFLWGAFTFFYSVELKTSLQELLRFFDLYALAFLAFIATKKREDFKTILQAFFVSSILPIAVALYQFIFHIGFQDENVSIPRIFGTFSHPNVFSLYLFGLIVLTALFFFVFAETRRAKLATFILLSIFTITLVLTFARVAWIALFVFLCLFALFRYRILLIPLIFFPVLLFFFSSTIQDRIQESFTMNPDSSLAWRQTLWHDMTLNAIQRDRVWFGSGMDTFPIVSRALRGTALGSTDPHNDFVKFFIEGGLVGLTVFIAYLISILALLLSRFRRLRHDHFFALAYGTLILFFLATTLASLSDNVYKNTPLQWLFFITLGSLLALSEHKKTSLKGSV